MDLQSAILVRQAGEHFRSSSPAGAGTGLSWTAVYDYVGINALDQQWMVDGMNTRGLSAGALWLPGSRYQQVTDNSDALAATDVVDWMLGSFSSVAEAQSALQSGHVQVWEGPLLTSLLPLHFSVHDARGGSMVVEYLDGQLSLTSPNPVAVLTNDPPFAWQLENLGSYAGLTPWDAAPLQIGQLQVSAPGHGSGLRGIPGDSTPPSRFVRAAYLKQFADTPADAAAACNLAFHILDAVDIPRGTSRARGLLDQTKEDYTQWAVVKDLANKILEMRFYDDMCVFSVDLKTLDFGAAAGQHAVPTTPVTIDITAQLGQDVAGDPGRRLAGRSSA